MLGAQNGPKSPAKGFCNQASRNPRQTELNLESPRASRPKCACHRGNNKGRLDPGKYRRDEGLDGR